MTKVIFFGYIVLALAIFLYSYGFTDFNLTLSSHPLVTNFVGWSQRLAMFNRPLSTNVYLGLIILLFVNQIGILMLWYLGKLSKFPWRPIGALALILSLAYPLLSSDVFKYLFTAKIIAFYHANPYLHPPNYFEEDLWLRFMRWVHTPTPYGPTMTALAVPYYFAGLGKFVPILYLYKLSQLGWYMLSIWCLGQLSQAQVAVRNQLFFALNPLVLVEWLVGAHNDAVMISLALLALVFLQRRRGPLATLALLASVGIKYVTIFVLPLLIFKKKLSATNANYYLLTVLSLSPLFYHYSTQYQPWYVTWLLPFGALSGSPLVMWLTATYSLGALLRYLPYISSGLWVGTPLQYALLTFLPPLLGLLVYNKLYALVSQAKKV